MGASDYKLITDRVGLWGAVALLVGTAMGMSIFVVPTQATAEAGPSIALAILVSIPAMILGVLLLLQMGGAIPVAGGIYVYASRLVGPFWGLIGVAIPVVAVTAYLVFAAMGFSMYFVGILETLGVLGSNVPLAAELGLMILAGWSLLAFFVLINYVGIQIVTRIQIALVFVLILGLLTFIVAGLLSFDANNLTPMFPAGEGEPFSEGITPFIAAVVLLYIPFQGFSMIIEIGEELEDPIKNIPRVLGIGMAIVTVLSIGLVAALAGAIPWQDTVNAAGEPVEAGLAASTVGGAIMPDWAVLLVAIGALVAAATTINTLLTSYSRTIMRAARDDVVPSAFSELHGEYNTPHRALLVLGVPSIVILPFAVVIDHYIAMEVIDWLVVAIVSGIFIAFMIGGYALWNLPKEFPTRYEHSFYKLPMPVLKAVAVGNVIVSGIFMIFTATTAPTALVFILVCMAIFAVVHVWRVRRYERKGIDLRHRMALLDKHEQVGADSGDD